MKNNLQEALRQIYEAKQEIKDKYQGIKTVQQDERFLKRTKGSI